jgi:hypothetical protein
MLTAFGLLIYIVPVLAIFGALAAIADAIERRANHDRT